MAVQQPTRALPVLHKASLSLRYRRNYTTTRVLPQ